MVVWHDRRFEALPYAPKVLSGQCFGSNPMFVKTFRLFVSSTFADFQQERELLQSKVFPALEFYCAAKGYQFLPIDLRWGVNAEAQLDQRTAEICLGEVDAVKDYPP